MHQGHSALKEKKFRFVEYTIWKWNALYKLAQTHRYPFNILFWHICIESYREVWIQTNWSSGWLTYQYPRTRAPSSLIKENTAPILFCHSLFPWIHWIVSWSLGGGWLVLELTTEQRALRSQVQCLKEIKLKIHCIYKLLLKTSILRKHEISNFLF